ncbi:hypothetical protein VDGL01_07619 [Verticillium dahliae]
MSSVEADDACRPGRMADGNFGGLQSAGMDKSPLLVLKQQVPLKLKHGSSERARPDQSRLATVLVSSPSEIQATPPVSTKEGVQLSRVPALGNGGAQGCPVLGLGWAGGRTIWDAAFLSRAPAVTGEMGKCVLSSGCNPGRRSTVPVPADACSEWAAQGRPPPFLFESYPSKAEGR